MLFKRKCKITFIRHGATINTEENRLLDNEKYPPINADGKIEAEKIANWIKNKGLKIDKIYSSSALRTVQTARIISEICKYDFQVIENLIARKSGIWSGLSFAEIERKYPNMLDEYHKNPTNYCPDGGETNAEFNMRVNKVISEIISENLNKRLIIITHGDVIQAAIANALKITPENQFKVYIPTGSATQISYFEDFASLVYSSYLLARLVKTYPQI